MADTTTSQLDRKVDRRAIGRSATRGLDRVLWQRISPSESRSLVAGVRHRRPAYLTVSLSAAAGLLEDGIPTVVAGNGDGR